MEEAVRQAFVARPHLVDDAPGYIRMEVLRPLGHPEEFWLMTWWQDEDAYDTWHRSHAYHDSHRGMPKGLKLVPGATEIRRFEQVVAAGANMHEFSRFEIADEFSGWLASSGAMSGVNLATHQISI